MTTLYNQPVVIDNGSGNLKAGFAGEETPRTHSSAVVGRPKYAKIMAGSLSGDKDDDVEGEETFVGNTAQQNRGLLRLTYPIEHGVVTNWADMERLWNHTYTLDLKTNAEDHPLLITEAPLNPRTNRDKMCQVLFEQFNVPCIYVSIQAVLSLYALGRTTGVVIDSGDGVLHIVPVYEGFSLPTLIKRMDLAGRDITEQLLHNMRQMTGTNLQSSSEMEIVRQIKEKLCYISKDPISEEKSYAATYNNADLYLTYRLPDGHEILLGVEKFRSPEILFNPQLVGNESPGLHELTALAIAKTDLDLRPILYQNVILSGGNTLIRNFGDRMLTELKKMQSSSQAGIWSSATAETYNTKMKVKIFAPPERKYSTWIGGSILAGLSTFKKMWITMSEYQEDPGVIHRKCM